MPSRVKELTEKRKSNLRSTGKGKNSMEEPGLKPSGPMASNMGNDQWDSGLMATMTDDILQWTSLVAGVGLCSYGVYGLTSKPKSSLWANIGMTALGAGLTYYAVNSLTTSPDSMGEEDMNGLENPAASVAHGAGIKVEESIIIHRSPEDLFDFWRNFENLPSIMQHLDSVEEIDDELSHWIARGPAGSTIEWDAEIYIERDAELISWRSTEDSDVDNAGSVWFEPIGDNATEVTVMLKYNPPAGKLGAVVAKLFGEEPSQQIREDLENFKRVMEAEGKGQPNQSYGDNEFGNDAAGNDL